MKKISIIFFIFFSVFVSNLFAQINTNVSQTGWYQYRYEGMTGTMVVSDSGVNIGNGLGYKLTLRDEGQSNYYPNVVIGKTLSTTYQRPTSVRMKVWIPFGYPILRMAVAFGNTIAGDTLWNTTTLLSIGSSGTYVEITMPVAPNGIATINQIFIALHSGAVGGQNFWFNIFLDEFEIFVNGVWIPIDGGFIPGTVPANRPNITDPYNGKIYQTNNVCIYWVQESGLTYQIQIASDPNFANIVVDQTGVTSPFCTYLNNGYYWVRMRSKFISGTMLTAWTIPINFGVQTLTGITPIGNGIPSEFKLAQNYPNPFNPVTNIQFDVPKTGNIKLTIYDVSGKEVETLINEIMEAGRYNTDFNASKLSSGVYFYRIEAEGFTDVKKMILIK